MNSLTRISTSQMFDTPTSMMASLRQQSSQLQTEIATGKKVQAPSDDPVSYVRLQSLSRATADDTANASNVKLAKGLLSQTDSTLNDISTDLQRAQEIAVQAASGTMSASDRAASAVTLDSIRDDLLKLANSTDLRGQPMFGGASGQTPYVQNADGSVSYTDSGAPAGVPIDGTTTVQTGVTGDRAFGNVKFGNGTSDMFGILAALSNALKGNDADASDTIGKAMDGIDATLDQVSSAQASVGARGARLDLVATRIDTTQEAREESRSSLEDVDTSTAIAQLQKTLTVLQATQSTFTKLSSLSLFDYLK